MRGKRGSPAFGGAGGDQGLPAGSVAGFTVIELIVTIVVLSILMGIAIPGFLSWLPNYRLRGATHDLYSNLQLAKMAAVKNQSICGVLFIDEGGDTNDRYQLIGSGDNRTFESTSGSLAGDDEILKEVRFFDEYGSGVSFGASVTSGVTDSITYNQNVITFSVRGTSTAGSVYLKNNKDASFRVGTSLSGAVDVKRWNGVWE